MWVAGTKPGVIAYIGETQFAPGEWAGVILDTPVGKNDGSVSGMRYFSCEPMRGVFSKLAKLTRQPDAVEGAALSMMPAVAEPMDQSLDCHLTQFVPSALVNQMNADNHCQHLVSQEAEKVQSSTDDVFTPPTEQPDAKFVAPTSLDTISAGMIEQNELNVATETFTVSVSQTVMQQAPASGHSPSKESSTVAIQPSTSEKPPPKIGTVAKATRPSGLIPRSNHGSVTGLNRMSLVGSGINLNAVSDTIKHGFKVGDRVAVSGSKPGTLRYIGTTDFAKGEWAGVELDEPQGKNNGAVEGKRYKFHSCMPSLLICWK